MIDAKKKQARVTPARPSSSTGRLGFEHEDGTFHEPQKVAQASCLFGADRLEACPTLQPAARFMAATHVRFLEVFALHEPAAGRRPAVRSAPL
ncbi:MAG: hypothetical protein DME18_09870 [Verrucomicrobia bacterium]|nr:MAG: hypothetical protein DME18_09870 [Verrucomicrobiota bacterium]